MYGYGRNYRTSDDDAMAYERKIYEARKAKEAEAKAKAKAESKGEKATQVA